MDQDRANQQNKNVNKIVDALYKIWLGVGFALGTPIERLCHPSSKNRKIRFGN